MTSRRPQLRRDETRAMFIDAGVAILREHGLAAGSDVLTLKRARDRVEADHGVRFVNASLIGRIWKDQADYQTDVLTTIASDDSNDEVAQTLDLVAPLLAGLDVRSPAARRWSLQEMCRSVSAVHLEHLAGLDRLGPVDRHPGHRRGRSGHRAPPADRCGPTPVLRGRDRPDGGHLQRAPRLPGFPGPRRVERPPVRHRRRRADRGLRATRPGGPDAHAGHRPTHGSEPARTRRGPCSESRSTPWRSSSSSSTPNGNWSAPCGSVPSVATAP